MVTILVLWDIDHTLIETRGVGGRIYADAFLRVTGRRLEEMPALSGRTEPVIFREALKAHHVTDTRDLYGQFAAEQARAYAERMDELRRQGRALPGALDALRKLAHRPDIIQSVLTGNTREAAELKLRAFGLDQYLDLIIGAYGTDDDTRANLVKIARQRATTARGILFDSATTVLIGDTPQRRNSRPRRRRSDHRRGDWPRQCRRPGRRRSRHDTRRPHPNRRLAVRHIRRPVPRVIARSKP